MATVNTCDGTGVPIPADTPVTGPFGHQYCDAARVVADEYLARRSAAHTEAAELFQRYLNDLRAECRAKLRQLPDDPA